MALVVCNKTFSQGGYGARAGELVDSTSYLYVKYPQFFTAAGDQTFAGTLGPVLASPNGTTYRVVVNNGGTLSTTAT